MFDRVRPRFKDESYLYIKDVIRFKCVCVLLLRIVIVRWIGHSVLGILRASVLMFSTSTFRCKWSNTIGAFKRILSYCFFYFTSKDHLFGAECFKGRFGSITITLSYIGVFCILSRENRIMYSIDNNTYWFLYEFSWIHDVFGLKSIEFVTNLNIVL